jgi:hypothetical protein
LAVDTSHCAQCGAAFKQRREHARFCCGRCRAAWNRDRTDESPVEVNALRWSASAMGEATELLAQVRVWDRARALAAIREAVWGVTIVDATLVRHYPDVYDAALAAQPPAKHRLTEDTLAGLRFVRNQIAQQVDLGKFVKPDLPETAAGNRSVTGWTWKWLPEPELASLPSRSRAWEMTRYTAYQARLAGHTVGESFERVSAFLNLTAANAASLNDLGARAAY